MKTKLDREISKLHSEKETRQVMGKVSCNLGKLQALGVQISFAEREINSLQKEESFRQGVIKSGAKKILHFEEKAEETIWAKHTKTAQIIKNSRLNHLSREKKVALAAALDRDFDKVNAGKIVRNDDNPLLISQFESHKIIKNLGTERLNALYGHNSNRKLEKLAAQKEADNFIKEECEKAHKEYIEERKAATVLILKERKKRAKRKKNPFKGLNYAQQLALKNSVLF